METNRPDYTETLTRHGIRPTAVRLLIYKTALRFHDTFRMSELEDALESVDKSTVFRTLSLFAARHLLHEIEDGSGSTKYCICRNDRPCGIDELHCHFHCEACRKTFCLDYTHIPAVRYPAGFEVRQIDYLLKGLCPTAARNGMYDPVRRQPPALQPGCKNFPLYLPPETDIVSPPLPHRRTRQKGAVFGKIDDGWKIFRTFAALRENRTMKIREEYKVREMAGEHVVIMQGRLGVDMTKIISLNESALYLWNALAGKEFSVDDAARLLTERYEVDDATAARDAAAWVEKLRDCKLI